MMTDRDGKKFRCNLPLPESTHDVNEEQQNGSSIGLTADDRSTRKTPEDLLEALKEKCFRRFEGWWIYELCYKTRLRQFHIHDKKLVQEFVLGSFDEEATAALHQESPNVSLQKDPRSQSAAQRYHAHVYTNGTICDLTDQRRETEVRFVCSETGKALINSIKEAPTCKYTVVFHAPMLCKHPYAPHVFPDT
jgi:protein OS-9